MPELLVVMAIILLFIVLAVPVMNVLTGSRSIAGAQNSLQTILARAHEQAIGLNRPYGVMFTLDPVSDRVRATIVREADPNFLPDPGRTNGVPIIWLDTTSDHDYVMLPAGIRLQTLFDGNVVSMPDRYLGYNPTPGLGDGSVKLGGVILFNGNGRLMVRRYGFATTSHDIVPDANPFRPGRRIVGSKGTAIIDLFFRTGVPQASERSQTTVDGFIPFEQSPGQGPWPMSQLGICLFDQKSFLAAGGTDDDVNQQNEATEENWLDQNATQILVNRFTGTLIKAE